MLRALCCLSICLVGLLGYIRVAPNDVNRWHVPITTDVDVTLNEGAVRIVKSSADSMATLDKTMRGFDRTSVLAGSVKQGLVTYVTRSKVVGFPDYTTIEQASDSIKMYARLRFGLNDLGVNAARLRKLVAVLN